MRYFKLLTFILFSSFSSLFADYNSATDLLQLSTLQTSACRLLTDPYNVIFTGSSSTDNYVVKYYNETSSTYCSAYGTSYYTNKKYYMQMYSFQPNYNNCPAGQEIINGVCAVPPFCASGSIWNSNKDICESSDSDGDGIPDKCDADFIGVSSLDCDGDGLANNNDGDIDGDGVPNSIDAEPLNSANTNTCSINTLSRSSAAYEQCYLGSSVFSNSNGSTSYYSEVTWDNCRNACYYKQKSCPRDQAILNGECRSVEPDISQCSGTSTCRVSGFGVGSSQECFKTCNCLTTSSPTPNSSNEYFYEEVSCADNQTDSEKLNDLKNNSDINSSVQKYDINGTANLNDASSFKAALDSYAGSKESTALDQLRELGIQSLQAIQTNTNLDKLNSTLENFSYSSTSNDGIINGTLNGIKDVATLGNELLSEIKDKATSILNNLDGKNSDGSSVDTSSLDSSFDGVDGSISSISSAFDNISSSYTSLTDNLNNGFEYSIHSGSGSVSFPFNAFGKHFNLDLSSLGQMAPIFYYMTYISMFLICLKITLLGFLVV